MAQSCDLNKENIRGKGIKRGRELEVLEGEKQVEEGRDSRNKCIKLKISRNSLMVEVASHNWT